MILHTLIEQGNIPNSNLSVCISSDDGFILISLLNFLDTSFELFVDHPVNITGSTFMGM